MSQHPRLEIILKTVADYYDLSPEVIRYGGKERAFVRARHVAVFLMSEMTPCTDEEVARAVNRERSTITYARKRVRELLELYPYFESEVKDIKHRIQAI